MRSFDYSQIKKELFTPDIVNLFSAIHEYRGKQDLFIEAQPDILPAMLEVAKIQSTGASNRIEGIYTSERRLTELVKEKALSDLLKAGYILKVGVGRTTAYIRNPK